MFKFIPQFGANCYYMKETSITVHAETAEKFRELRERTDAFGSDEMIRRLMFSYVQGPPAEQDLRL